MRRNELYHYGVKGMRWGVRKKYENYPGTYTQKGVKKFYEQSDKYDAKRSEYLNTKAAYKAGKATKLQLNTAKKGMRDQKRKMKSSYKHLRQDKLGDQGKELYAKGKRITWNNAAHSYAQIGVAAVSSYFEQAGNRDMAVKTAIGGTAVNVGLWAVKEYQNTKLRAYYGHTPWRG